MNAKNTICLWYDKDAEAAARFYAATFPDSEVTAVRKAPGDFPGGKAGDVLTVEFTVLGVPCIGLNGGPTFKQSEAFSFQVATDDQEETDRYWNAIVGNGGQESECGWCKDRWGLSWQITPRTLTEAMAAGGAEAKRAFDAMMTMQKIDVASHRRRAAGLNSRPHPHQYDRAPRTAKTRLFLHGRGPYHRPLMSKRTEDRRSRADGQRLQRLLDGPDLARVAPHLAPEVLHRLIRHAGLEQCVDLVEALSRTQLTAVLDLDLWRAPLAGGTRSSTPIGSASGWRPSPAVTPKLRRASSRGATARSW